MNVYPADIEEVVIQHEAVSDVAVFGVPHPEWGETPVAAVVLKEHKRASSSIEIQNWVNNHIDARFQKLSEIMIVAELPRNIAGKVLKHELKKRHENAK